MGEGSGRHLGDIWEESEIHLEASGRHLRGTSGGSMGPGGILELGWPWEASGSQMC